MDTQTAYEILAKRGLTPGMPLQHGDVERAFACAAYLRERGFVQGYVPPSAEGEAEDWKEVWEKRSEGRVINWPLSKEVLTCLRSRVRGAPGHEVEIEGRVYLPPDLAAEYLGFGVGGTRVIAHKEGWRTAPRPSSFGSLEHQVVYLKEDVEAAGRRRGL